MTNRYKLERWLLWLSLFCLLVIAAFRSNYAAAYYSAFETTGSNFFAGTWEVEKEKGTSISVEKNAVGGYREEVDGGYINGVQGQICVTNDGESPTEGLSILDMIQYKSDSDQFQDYDSAEVDINEKPVLEPGESYCYLYDIPFEPVDGDNIKYRNSVSITILNYSDWLPGTPNCEGSDPCPFGLNLETEFELPEPIIPVAILSAKQTASGFIETSKEEEAYYGAGGEVCITNDGEHETKNLGIYTVVENKLGDQYKEKAAQTLNTNEKPVLAPGESHCYDLKISFPDPDENVIEPRIVTMVTISNHAEWMPGDASCPGPDACYYGPTLETYFEIPKNETARISEPVQTPETGASLLAAKTATGFVEEREGVSVFGVRGDVCVTNEGQNTTDDLSIQDSIQFRTEEDVYEEIKSDNFDLSAYPTLESGETHCFPYEFIFDPQQGENIQYRNFAIVTIHNQTGWLPGDENCPGEKACSFELIVFADFGISSNNDATTGSTEIETPTPEPTETATETSTSVPGETETPSPEPIETETSTPEPTETPSPEPTEKETSTSESVETETPTPEPNETEPPAITESASETPPE